jgi:hypothetical protein
MTDQVQKYFRRIIQIRAEDSPNVARALEMKRRGLEPDGLVVLAGVLTWDEYKHRTATWSEQRKCVGLDGRFYEGKEELLWPPEWLNACARASDKISSSFKRVARGGGCDPAEGGDKTTFTAVDDLGLIEIESTKTPDTSKIPGMTIGFIQKHGIPPDRFCFDRGGGGKQHADNLRAMGYPVRTIGFGETVTPDLRRGMTPFKDKKDQRETKYEFENRRTQMYWEASEFCDPTTGRTFAIPDRGPTYQELFRQLGLMPKLWSVEGRARMPPKRRKPGQENRNYQGEQTIEEIVGHSPDEADSFVLAIHGMLHRATDRSKAGGGS